MTNGAITWVMLGAIAVATGCGGAQGPATPPSGDDSTLEVAPGDATPPAGAGGVPGGQTPTHMGTDPTRTPAMGGDGPAE